jgi:hypothetical protein
MMPEPLACSGAASGPARPFPWFCPNCRRKEVRRATIPYQCQLPYKGQPVTVVLANLAVPKCGHCGELVFDYEADEQINQAFKAQTDALDQLRPQGPAKAQIARSHANELKSHLSCESSAAGPAGYDIVQTQPPHSRE